MTQLKPYPEQSGFPLWISKSGYWQVPLDDLAKEKTAFSSTAI